MTVSYESMPRVAPSSATTTRKALAAGLLLAGLGAAPWPTNAIEFTPEGRVHVDYAAPDSDRKPLHDNLQLRRARLGLQIKFDRDWSAEIEYDFAKHDARRNFVHNDGIKNVLIEYEGWRAGDVTLGQFKAPFGLEESASSNNTMFMERSLATDAFAPSRRIGIGFDRHGKRYTFAAMAFRRAIDNEGGKGLAARYTFAPIDGDQRVLHFGASFITEKPEGKVKINPDPESSPIDTDFVDTKSLRDVRRSTRVGLEAAWQGGPLSLQAEWMHAWLDRREDVNADFSGWYVEGSWVLTGETREYKRGEFKGVTPSRPSGAWELTARYSHIDLNDGPVRGGTEGNLTLGANWYLGRHWRLMANYVRVHSKRHGERDNPDILMLRAQFAW